jgi:hypothetical protein
MKAKAIWIVAITMVALVGCHKAEPPATVHSDVGQAQDAAAEKEAKAKQKAAETVASANQDVAAESRKADEKTANAAYDVAIAKAEGNHKIAVARCERLSGDAHKACVDQADAAHDT